MLEVFSSKSKKGDMKGGRKNLKRAAEEDSLNLRDGQGIMQVISLRGSNLIEVKSYPFFFPFQLLLHYDCFLYVCRMIAGPRNVLAYRLWPFGHTHVVDSLYILWIAKSNDLMELDSTQYWLTSTFLKKLISPPSTDML